MIGSGLVGATICSLVVDRTKRFTELVRICYPGATAGILMVELRVVLMEDGPWIASV